MKRYLLLLLFCFSVNVYADSVIDGGSDIQVRKQSALFFEKSSDPSSPAANGIKLYAKDKSGTTTLYTKDSSANVVEVAGAGTVAPKDATYITQTANSTLTNEQALGSLTTGILKNTTTTGVLSIASAGTDFVAPGTTISTTSPLTGGGDLSTNRTFAINDAAADGSTKGAAAFNSTNFSASSGVVNTIQNIATTSSPTFQDFALSDTTPLFTFTDTTAGDDDWTCGANGDNFTCDNIDVAGTDFTIAGATGNATFKGSVTTTAIVDSGLTNGRVPIAGIGGLLGDDSDMTFSVNTLTVTGVSVGATGISTSGNITSSGTGTLGWSVVAVANQACTTTCTSACVMGVNVALGNVTNIVNCADATADTCLCAGAS